MDNNFWKKQQIGNLWYRRIEKLSFMCMVTFNIWVNILTGYLLKAVKWSAEKANDATDNWLMNNTINKLFDTKEYANFWKDMVHIISIVSIILSIILWYQIVKGFLFMIGDYKSTYEEKGKKVIWPFILVGVANIIVFAILKSLWWP